MRLSVGSFRYSDRTQRLLYYKNQKKNKMKITLI